MSHSKSASSPYQIKFKTYLLQNLAYLHHAIQSATPIPAEEVRTQAMHTLSYALKVGDAWSPTRDLVFMLASPMEQAGHREDWIPYLLRTLEQSIAGNDQSAAAEFHFQLALLYRLLSQFKSAYEHITAGIDRFSILHDAHNQARALNELAWLEHLQHRYKDASRHVEQALTLLTEDDPECGMSYRVQGMIEIGQGQWEKAEKFHRQALGIFEQQGNIRRIGWGLQNLAYALRGQRKFIEAITIYQRSYAILLKIGDIHSLAVVLFNLGIAYYHNQEFDKSISNLNQACTVFKELNNKLFLARIHTDIGLTLLAQQAYKEAENAFSISIRLFQEIGDEPWRLNAMDGLAMTYLVQQKYPKAIKILEEALIAVSKVSDAPNYNYLFQSLHTHLETAERGYI